MAFKIGETNFLPTVLDLSTKEMVDGTLIQANLVDATLIYNYAFFNQKNLNYVYAHNAESIGYRSFYGCTALKSVHVNGCKTIGESAFEGCTDLRQIYISKELTFIDKDAFKNCTVLGVYFDGNMEDWAKITFANEYSNPVMCYFRVTRLYIKDEFGKYVDVKDLVIPANVSSIGKYTYRNLTAIESITILGKPTIPAGAFSRTEYLSRFTIDGDGGLNLLADYFNEDTSQYTYETQKSYLPLQLKYFTYNGDSIKTRFCYGTDLRYVTFNGTTINASAFEGCSRLSEITLSSRLTSIKSDAFKNCSVLRSVKYTGDIYITPESSGWLGISFENTYSNPLSNNNASLYLYNESSDTWYQPTEYYDSHNTVGNITLPSYTFHNIKQITKVDLTAGKVVALGEHSFDGCTNLTTINFGTTITEIPQYAFARTGITTLTLPNTFEDIRPFAFAECLSLDELIIPDDYLDLPNHRIWISAFLRSYPSKLTTPDLEALYSFEKTGPTSYKYTGGNFRTLFYNPPLTPFSNTTGDYNNKYLKEMYITHPGREIRHQYGNHLSTLLDERKLYDLPNLNKLSIPNYKHIEENCFYNDKALTELTYRGTKSEFDYAVTSTTYEGSPSSWHRDSAITVVHCTDGDITV